MARNFGSSILVRRENSHIVAVLNRPEKLNALNREMFEELESLVDVLETDKTIRAVIFVGAGEKAFCVGADLKERQGMNERDILQRFAFVHKLYPRLEALRIPSIAALNGATLGGGLELALACDFRIAVDSAMLGLPETGLGIIPGNGGTQRLTRVVGLSRSMEMILLAKKITAREALSLGLVTQVVEPNQLMSQAKAIVQQLELHGPLAISAARKAIRRGIELPLAKALELEVECYRPLIQSKDRLEGMKAFTEKRKPVFTGE